VTSDSSPKFSVIIPTLNEAQNIRALLEALRAQEYSGEWEIIVVDGGSDDGTSQMAQGCAGVLVLQTARGVSRQRNAGARRASGDVLVFMDADDLPSPDFLRCVAQSYRNLPFAVACPWFVAGDSGLLVRVVYFGFNLLFTLSQSTLRTGSGVCLITPKKVWEKVGGFDEALHLGEDMKYIRSAAPRFGLHRHLWVPLQTSGRRFRSQGAWKLMLFYARITPLILLSRWRALQKIEYNTGHYE
jgi:glycosyltransferase involved in cell wall biosynthesis